MACCNIIVLQSFVLFAHRIAGSMGDTYTEKGEPERPKNDASDDDVPSARSLPTAPDGGYGWVILFASFVCNMLVDGVCFTFGLFYLEFLKHFGESKAKTAWVGSILNGMYLTMGEHLSCLDCFLRNCFEARCFASHLHPLRSSGKQLQCE